MTKHPKKTKRMVCLIKPIPLSKEAFAPYGDVIELSEAAEQKVINQDNTVRYHDLARLELTQKGGRASLNIFRSTPLTRPVMIKVMERHPLSSQTFYPLGTNPWLVVVAAKGKFDYRKITAFLARPDQGVNYHAGVWHHYSLALHEISDFLVIDRLSSNDEDNCEEITLNEKYPICIDY